MRSKEQEIRMLKDLTTIIELLPTTNSIKEISEITEIPTSTIQRYLNKKELIIKILEKEKFEDYYGLFEYIDNWLKNSKIEGNRKGGVISQERHSYSKDEVGKFTGNNRKK